MGVEIENLIESSIGVALPPTSLMRARTIGQIASLISEHIGGSQAAAATGLSMGTESYIRNVLIEALGEERANTLIDHILMSPAALSACTAVEIDLAARDGDKPSDHAPVVATLA